MLKRILLTKVAFWLIIIGAAILLMPQARPPHWLGWLLLVAGTILGPMALLAGPRDRPRGPDASAPSERR
jgi:hypothetical protein